jgi:hypothetical protein
MSQGEAAEVGPVPEPRSGAGADEAHKSQLLVREALAVITAVVRTLIDLVADLRSWCALLEHRANDADAADVPRRRRELAAHQDRLVTAEALLARARRKRATVEELAMTARKSAGEPGRADPDREPASPPAPAAAPAVGSEAAGVFRPGSAAGTAKNRLREVDRSLATADEELDAYDAHVAAVRVLIESGARAASGAESGSPAVTPAVAETDLAEAGAAAEAESGTADAPEDRKLPAPVWTTWCTILTGCCLLLAVILGGTSFTYARWEHPGAGTVTVYAVGDLLALAAAVALSLLLLSTLVDRYVLSTLGETALVLAILLVPPVLGAGLWHPQAFGHMGMWGRSLARSLV